MHQHVLWGIDDGPKSRKEMIALLQRDAEQGIGIVAATSHALPGVRPFDIELYWQRLKEAQAYCSDENLTLRVISGAEIRYTPMMLSMLLDHKLPTLGDSELTGIHLKTQSVSCSAMASFRLLPMWSVTGCSGRSCLFWKT